MRKERNKKVKNKTFPLMITLIALIVIGTLGYYMYTQNEIKKEELKEKKHYEDILSHYNKTVITNKEVKLYQKKDNEYISVGTVKSNELLSLVEKELTYQDDYLEVSTFDNNYYINYQDVTKFYEDESPVNDRYKKYLPFNKNIITKELTNFYDEEGTLVYKLNKSYNLPIIIKDKDKYGVELNNKLLYVKQEDVADLKDNKNTGKSNTPSIAVLNYHFFYDEKDSKAVKECNQIICHSKSLFKTHLEFIKNNNIFTPTMKEFEQYLNGQIRLPKSVLITIDDGWRMQDGIDLLEEYKVNATVFLITSWFKNEIKFLNDYKYVEFHSHGDNLHTPGACPGGQGGPIKCLNKTKLLEDLALSRKKLNNTTYFCYPFYEYNNYSIGVLKEAGFTLSFAGGFRRAKSTDNRYALPRYVIYNNTTANQLKNYIG